jgi:hypothetical protein
MVTAAVRQPTDHFGNRLVLPQPAPCLNEKGSRPIVSFVFLLVWYTTRILKLCKVQEGETNKANQSRRNLPPPVT